MKLPGSVQQAIESKFADISSASASGGGSINQAARVDLQDGTALFVKWNSADLYDMFVVEEKGLNLLRNADSGLKVPRPLHHNKHSDEQISYLILEYLPEGRSTSETDTLLGEGLAALHQNTADTYGLNHDNYIGRLPQYNTPHANWIDFFINQRLTPQLKMATDRGLLDSRDRKAFDALFSKLPGVLSEEPASLLHGDLWGGNQFATNSGEPAIFDPAVYYGNREIELAFTYLFGGFGRGFYSAYHSVWPLQPGFDERKDIYNLYPLLVHVNLFGSVYAGQVKRIISRYS